MPSPTPTVTVTPTLTPTPTTVKYWLKMLRCDEDQTLLNYHYSLNSYVNNTIQRGDLFRGGSNGQPGPAPAGFFYYEVVDLLLTDPSGTVEGSKSVAPYATNCGEDPTHFVGATYRTAHINLFGKTGFTSYNQFITDMCGKTPPYSAGFIGSGAYADATVTGTSLTPGILYDLYPLALDGTPKWTTSGLHYWGVFNTSTYQVDKIVRIENGTITEWRDCSGNLITYP